MYDIEIRRAKIEDIKNVIPVLSRAWRYAYDGVLDADFVNERTNPQNYPERIKRWEQNFEKKGREIFLVAEIEDNIVGFAVGGAPKNTQDADRK